MSELRFSEAFAKKRFYGQTTKEAYITAMKWYATNILAKGQINDVQVEIIKDPNLPAVTMVLYAFLDESAVRNEHCECCKEVHKLFYVSADGGDCSKCPLAGYHNRLDRQISVKVHYYKEQMRKLLKKGGAAKNG